MAFGLDDALIGMAVAQGVGGLLGSDAAKTAAGQQSNAANQAGATQLKMFNTINEQSAPYRQAGYTGVDALLSGLGLPMTGAGNLGGGGGKSYDQIYNRILGEYDQQHQARYGIPLMSSPDAASLAQQIEGIKRAAQNEFDGQPKQTGENSTAAIGGITPGYFSHTFNANDLNDNLAPNYKFMLDQGLGATKNAANLQTGLISGNLLKGVNDYAQNYAGNAYQSAFNNYTANQNNIFNRLATIAGYGTQANQTTANAGMTAATNAGNAQMAAGAAQAAGTVGSTNALTGAANNAASWFALPSIMKMGGGGGFDMSAVPS